MFVPNSASSSNIADFPSGKATNHKSADDHFDCFDCVNCDLCESSSECHSCGCSDCEGSSCEDDHCCTKTNMISQESSRVKSEMKALSMDMYKKLFADSEGEAEAPFSGVQPRFSDSRRESISVPHTVKVGKLEYTGPAGAADSHDHKDLMFCHWSGHDHEVSFPNELDLEKHLKQDHSSFNSSSISCQWDSCDLNLDVIDDLLPHIKKDHITHHPHYECNDHSSPVGWHHHHHIFSNAENQEEANSAMISNHHNNHLNQYDLSTHHHDHNDHHDHHDHTHRHNHHNHHNHHYNHHHNHQHNHQHNQHNHHDHHNHHSPSISQQFAQKLEIVTPTPQQLLKCHWDSCEFNANNTESLNNHLFNIHGEQNCSVEGLNPANTFQGSSEPSAGISPFQCEWKSCDFASVNYNELVSHQQTTHMKLPLPEVKTETTSISTPEHKVEDEHRCLWVTEGNVCNCLLQSAEELSNHLVENHVGSRKSEYVCLWQGCDRNCKPFQQRQKIIRHLQTHSKNKPYACPICGHTFGEESVLKQHIRVHSGEKPFECHICHKRFAANTALSVHLRTHTGEKPLCCKFPGCNKRFSESSNLNKHMKTHYAFKAFICHVCNKKFTRHDQLQRHLKTHILDHVDDSSNDRNGHLAVVV